MRACSLIYLSKSASSKLAICSLLAFIVGCSSGGDSGGGPAADNVNKDASSPEQAISWLSADHRSSFEKWKKSLVKSCNASQVIGAPVDYLTTIGLDLKSMAEANNKSNVYVGQNGEFLFLADWESYSGTGESSYINSSDDNGQRYRVAVKATTSGSDCVIYLFNQEVYRTKIAAKVQVGGLLNLEKVEKAEDFEKINAEKGVFSSLKNAAFAKLFQSALQFEVSDRPKIQKVLGLDEDGMRRFVVLGKTEFNSSLSLNGLPWTSGRETKFIGNTEALKALLSGPAQNFQAVLRLPVTPFSEGQLGKVVRMSGDVKYALADGSSEKYNVQVGGLKAVSGLFVPETNDFDLCVMERTRVLSSVVPTSANQISPRYSEVMNSCSVFRGPKELNELLLQTGILEKIFPVLLADFASMPLQFSSSDWETVIIAFATNLIKNNRDIRGVMDPLALSPFVTHLTENMNRMKVNLGKMQAGTEEMSDESLYDLAAHWAFFGYYKLETIDQAATTLRRLAASLTEAARVLKLELRYLRSQAFESLNYASSMTAAHIASAARARLLALDLGYLDFTRDVLEPMLEKRTSQQEFEVWSQKLQNVKTQIAKVPKLEPLKKQVVALAVKWQGEMTSNEAEKNLKALEFAVEPFRESTQRLLLDLLDSSPEALVGLAYAATLTEEHKQLAKDIQDNLTKLNGGGDSQDSFFTRILQVRPTLQDMRIRVTVLKEAIAFRDREKTRVGESSESYINKDRVNNLIRRALTESWGKTEFEGLEAIVQLGNYSSFVKSYVGASNRAYYLGDSYFSKGAKKIFDPQYGNRYIVAAQQLMVPMSTMDASNETFRRDSLMSKFFTSNLLFSSCDNNLFNQKVQTTINLINQLATTSDTMKKWDLERQFDKSLEDCKSNP